MAATYNLAAPKKPLNLSLNTDLISQAREFTDNLSAEVESLPASFVVKKKRSRNEQHMQSLRLAAQDWNHFVNQHGSFADEYSTL